jgi:T-complex protein 1 subunit gamma
MSSQVYVMDPKTKREQGKKAQFGSILAAKAVADIIRTTLGPNSMLKMLLDAQGGIVLTNDGNAILREIDVSHPAAKSMLTLARTQEETVGDGTTTVVLLTGEILHVSEPFISKNLHPTIIIKAYNRALQSAIHIIDVMAFPVDTSNRRHMLSVINSCICTKFSYRFGNLMAELALDAVCTISAEESKGHKVIDFKKHIKIEKIPGGGIGDCQVLNGVIFNKDVINPGRMRRKIINPRIILLDCPLEYKKGENMINVEMTKEDDFASLLEIEEGWIRKMCSHIISFDTDIVITEKGLSDLAAHYLQKNGVSAIRRVRKSDNNRISRACGATIVHRPDEIVKSDVGTGAGLFEVRKIGDEFFTFIIDCENPKACSIILRGASRDFLNEIERNILDAIGVARNVILHPRLLPGGGAVEMEISRRLSDISQQIEGIEQWPFLAIGIAMEVVPRTLAQNCGVNVIRTLTKLRAKHTESGCSSWGVNGETGQISDMKEIGLWEPLNVKSQTIKTAIESACLLLRIDDIVSGISKRDNRGTSSNKETQKGDINSELERENQA